MSPWRNSIDPTSHATHAPLHRGAMLLVCVLAVVPLGGCQLGRMGKLGLWDPPEPQLPTLTADADKEQIVAHLNDNIRKLRGWQSNDVKIKAKGIPIELSASIAVERPRNFRLRARSLFRGDETDFGSNDERFWFWIRDSPQKSIFTARHENVHLVQQRMHIPFDPDWLVESLGVVEIDPSRVSLERTDPSGRVVDLFEERILANGQRAKLATTVDTGTGLIVGRTLYDPRGQRVARATITRHRVHEPDGPDGGVVMPHEIQLEWPKTETTLTLHVGRMDINPSIEMAMFTLPKIPQHVVHEIDGGMAQRGPVRSRTVPLQTVGLTRTAELDGDDRGFRFEDEIEGGEPEFDPAMFEPDSARSQQRSPQPGPARSPFDEDAFERGPDNFAAPEPGRHPLADSGTRSQSIGIGESMPIDGPRPREFDPNEFDPSEFEPPEFESARMESPRAESPRMQSQPTRSRLSIPDTFDSAAFAPPTRSTPARSTPSRSTSTRPGPDDEAWYDE